VDAARIVPGAVARARGRPWRLSGALRDPGGPGLPVDACGGTDACRPPVRASARPIGRAPARRARRGVTVSRLADFAAADLQGHASRALRHIKAGQ
jgi:hypothetical protein